jgi:hypothetical protein
LVDNRRNDRAQHVAVQRRIADRLIGLGNRLYCRPTAPKVPDSCSVCARRPVRVVSNEYWRAKRLPRVGASDNAQQRPDAPPRHEVPFVFHISLAFVDEPDGGVVVPVEPGAQPINATYPRHTTGLLARSERLRDQVIELRRCCRMRPTGQGSVIGEEHALCEMSASYRIEPDQLQLSGLPIRPQVAGVCSPEAVARDSHLADSCVQERSRAEHAGSDRMFPGLMAPSGIRI